MSKKTGKAIRRGQQNPESRKKTSWNPFDEAPSRGYAPTTALTSKTTNPFDPINVRPKVGSSLKNGGLLKGKSKGSNPFGNSDSEDEAKGASKGLGRSKRQINGTGTAPPNPFDVDELGGNVDRSMDAVIKGGSRYLERLQVECMTLEAIMSGRITDPITVEDFRIKLSDISETLLAEEATSQHNQVTPCLEYILNNDLVENMRQFAKREEKFRTDLLSVILTFSTKLIKESKQPLLIHHQLLRPWLHIMESLKNVKSKELLFTAVTFLYHLWQCISHNPALVNLFHWGSHVGGREGEGPGYPLVGLLMDHIHQDGCIGEQTRETLLILLWVCTTKESGLLEYLVQLSNFSELTASGLCARYASLPNEHHLTEEDWWILNKEDLLEGIPALAGMLRSLEFCDTVLELSPPAISKQLLEYIRITFLQNVLGPTFLQVREPAVMTAMVYLDSFLKHVHSKPFLKEFLHFIVKLEIEDQTVLAKIVLAASNQSAMLSAAAFNLLYTLVDMNCEDIMLALVFKHLIYGRHLPQRSWTKVEEVDVYNEIPQKLLSMIPVVCQQAEKKYYESVIARMKEARKKLQPSEPEIAQIESVDVVSSEKKTASPRHLRSQGSPLLNQPSSTLPKNSSVAAHVGPNRYLYPPQQNKPSSRLEGPSSSQPSHGVSAGGQLPALEDVMSGASKIGVGQCLELSEGDSTSPGSLQPPLDAPLVTSEVEEAVPLVNGGPFSEEEAYYCYLYQAHESVTACALACQCWSSSYSQVVEDVRSESHSEASSPIKENYFPHPIGLLAGPLIQACVEKMSMALKLPYQHLLLVTRLVSRLAAFPQPILRGYLLGNRTPFKDGAPNLLKVLSILTNEISALELKDKDFDVRLAKARKTLVIRMQDALNTPTMHVSGVTSQGGSTPQTTPTKTTPNKQGSTPKKKTKNLTNRLFCIVIFHDFLKELASLSQVHSILDEQLYRPA